ncbi:YceI family protein [Hymenobacter sp. B81]|uniref:YceI family protein n=1 Tax=Hymenobacter sp. B81 TaxID=3344878 RepID=UPI0037DC48A8
MKPLLIALAAGLLLVLPAVAQKYAARAGTVTFFSSAPLEDISARNTQVAASIDLGTQQLAFVVPMKEFVFANGLMQQHFNENYVESDKYPRATFSGRLLDWPAAGLPASGAVPVQVEGELTIRGVKRRIRVPGTLERQGAQLVATTRFDVAPADYHIEIPALVREHIAKSVTVRVQAVCAPQP